MLCTSYSATEENRAEGVLCIAVSACLLGKKCRYDGKTQLCSELLQLKQMVNVQYVAVCPEVLGGLPVPRPSSEIVTQVTSEPQTSEESLVTVINRQGNNVTTEFEIGADKALLYAKNNNAKYAILKAYSPSCGSGVIYDGTFSKTKTAGWGIAAKKFAECGMSVIDEYDVRHIVDTLKNTPRTEHQATFVRLLDLNHKLLSSNSKTVPCDQNVHEHPSTPETLAPSNKQNYKRKATFKKALGHARVITKHKLEVAKLCARVGLVKQALTHDLSKYTPKEFMAGARFFQGTRSPNAVQREIYGYSAAWLHHKGRNKHHLEYWLDLSDDPGVRLYAAQMPARYVVEMFCDRVAASKTYKGNAYTPSDPLEYYQRSKDVLIIHPETRLALERLLVTLAEQGENEALREAKRYLYKSKQAEKSDIIIKNK